ncbi:MAG: class I SAM-dependent methyltransferase [Actinomycetota bacterium]
MANEEQAKFWTEQGGPIWLAKEEDLNASSLPFGRAAMDAAKIGPGDVVLDIGCGTGPTTLEIADRIGPNGRAIGFDISPLLIERARKKAATAGTTNVEFLVGDAQTAAFEPVHDLVFSRFGVMFFEDPVAAFTNIRSALRDDGRIAFACWQDVFKNVWMLLPTLAGSSVLGTFDLPPEGTPGPFYYGDGELARKVLTEAGFRDIDVSSFETTMDTPADEADDRLMMALNMGPLGEKFREADDATKRQTVDAVKAAAAEHLSDGVYRLPGAAWIVTGHR